MADGSADTSRDSGIDSSVLQQWFADGAEIALLDVREEGLFGEGHAFFASNLPYSRLERIVTRLVPRKATRVVLLGDPEIDILAERRLVALGYTNVSRVKGGLAAWEAAGNTLFASVGSPSKAFAEAVEQVLHTPSIKAADLQRLRDDGADVTVLDSRTLREFDRFHVPGAISCPGAELVLRFEDLVPSPETLVVVSCAGRTRGIIGAQALRNAGVPNRVVALEGGTQGWKLADLPIASGRDRAYGPVSKATLTAATARAERLANHYGVERIGLDTLREWSAETDRSLFIFDVRTPEEYAAGHLPDVPHVQGGQLVQSLDTAVAVRGARIVLVDDLSVRAVVTAHWLRQMGWEAAALSYDPASTVLEQAPPPEETPITAGAPLVSAETAATLIRQGAAVVSTDSSAEFRDSHARGALWANRSRLSLLSDALSQASSIVILGRDAAASQLVARDLSESFPQTPLSVAVGSSPDWEAAGIALNADPDAIPDKERIDFLFWLHDRHLGNSDASRAYLAWEESLPAQIGSPEAAGYRIRASQA